MELQEVCADGFEVWGGNSSKAHVGGEEVNKEEVELSLGTRKVVGTGRNFELFSWQSVHRPTAQNRPTAKLRAHCEQPPAQRRGHGATPHRRVAHSLQHSTLNRFVRDMLQPTYAHAL
jgi:hypothetical protein